MGIGNDNILLPHLDMLVFDLNGRYICVTCVCFLHRTYINVCNNKSIQSICLLYCLTL